MTGRLALGSVLLLVGLLYLPTFGAILRIWEADPNYSHGFLIVPFSAWLIWQRRAVLSAGRPSVWGFPLLIAGLLLLVAGTALEAVGTGRGGLFVRGISLIVVLAGLVVVALGRPGLSRLGFPIAYLAFMVPLPVGLFAMITLPLQLYASDVTTTVLQVSGIPAVREGNLIHLPTIVLGVVEACSGIRSLITLLAGALALGVLALERWWQRLVLVASVVPIAVATNAIRIVVTGLLAQFVGTEAAEGFFHGFSSWLMLLCASLVLCAEVLLIDTLSPRSMLAGRGEPETSRRGGSPLRGLGARLGVAAGLLAASFAVLQVQGLRGREPADSVLVRLESFPYRVGAWKGEEESWGSEVVAALDADDWILRQYQHPTGAVLWLYVGVSDDVSFSGGTSPHSPMLCYPGQGWEFVEVGLQDIALSDGQSVPINRLVVQKGLERRLVLYWKQWGGEITAETGLGDYRAKLGWLLRLPGVLHEQKRVDRALVRISGPVVGSVRESLELQLDFLEQAIPHLARHLAFDRQAEIPQRPGSPSS